MQLQCHELSNPDAAVQRVVNAGLFKWDSELGACPIKSSKVGIVKENGDILDELPFVLAAVQAKYTCFSPRPGCLLQGTVVDFSEEHIGTAGLPDLLVFGLFNATVKREDIDSLKFQSEVRAGQQLCAYCLRRSSC